MEVWEAIRRRSVRKYKPEPIGEELIEKILEAGLWAPSASNMQMWGTREFIVVEDVKIMEMTRKVSPGCPRSPSSHFCMFKPEESL